MYKRFTMQLKALGFTPGAPSADGVQHRWFRGEAHIDVLLPEGLSEEVGRRPGADGFPSVSAPGGTQALDRSESVAVDVNGVIGRVRRPNLVGALVMKAAAHTVVGDVNKARHRSDFLTLAEMVAARDFRGVPLGGKDRRRLREMVAHTRADRAVMLGAVDAEESLRRLVRVAGLG
jgi:hypothetical protein